MIVCFEMKINDVIIVDPQFKVQSNQITIHICSTCHQKKIMKFHYVMEIGQRF